jgi:hypothetical protein
MPLPLAKRGSRQFACSLPGSQPAQVIAWSTYEGRERISTIGLFRIALSHSPIGISSPAQVLVHVDVLMTCTTLKNTLTSLDDFGTSFFRSSVI